MSVTRQLRPHDFLSRFHNCDDGVLRQVNVRFSRKTGFEVDVTLSVMEATTESDDRWVNLRISIAEVREFAFREGPKTTCRVLSGGVHIDKFDGLLFFDFDSHDPRNIEDYRRSDFYVAGGSFTWQIAEYSE